MAGPDLSSAQSAMSAQLFASGQIGGGAGGHGHAPGSTSSLLEVLFGKLGGTMVGAGVSPITHSAEGLLQAANIMRMLFTISGGFFRSIVESIKRYIGGAAGRLSISQIMGAAMGGRGGGLSGGDGH
ncbi:MAG: hypothetical protein J0L97_04430 [Alphaproteobacteria bacterium]|nr:hypothetical protein [Alphaproteobacteria bacterium]